MDNTDLAHFSLPFVGPRAQETTMVHAYGTSALAHTSNKQQPACCDLAGFWENLSEAQIWLKTAQYTMDH
jgi:hypothetical protein